MVNIESNFNDTALIFVPDKKNFTSELELIVSKIQKEKQKPFNNVFLIFPKEFQNFILNKLKNIKIKSLSKTNKEVILEI